MPDANHLPAPAPVLLASMPFGLLHSPSLALGILQARLEAAGIASACRHFTVDYAARIGVETYERIAGGFPSTTSLLGEWIFGHALHARDRARQEAYLAAVLGPPGPTAAGAERRRALVADLLALAADAGEFVDFAAREILALAPRVVGLTSVFEQNVASLALARRLRALAPDLVIVLGGANCEGTMGRELARHHPFVDVVVSGEADALIAPLVAGLLRGLSWQDNPALQPFIDAQESAGSFLQARMVHDLAQQPRPRFQPYFDDLARQPAVRAALAVQLPLESARGCWWGEKHHCTFCGLNGATMAFRSRPAAAVVEDVRAYAAEHPGLRLCFVDNIMDSGYFETLLPELARLPSGARLFYEIKSNVSRAQVRALRDAGVRHVQPGIESLSDHVLGLMRKGVSAMQNLQLLKWCMEDAVRVDWNILWGFPGETPQDYAAMARLAPLLTHLEPPARGARIRLDRHSPNYREAAAFGFRNVRPFASYRWVYDGLPPRALENLAYFFEAEHALDAQLEGYTRALAEAMERWRAAHRASTFFHLQHGDTVILLDARAHRRPAHARALSPLAGRLAMACDSARTLAGLARALPDTPPQRIAAELEDLCRDEVLWCDGRRYLCLALSLTTYLASRRGAQLERGMDMLLGEAAAPA